MAVLPPIRGPIKYLAELFKTTSYDPRLAIADAVFDRSYNIYGFSVAPLIVAPTNYWIIWGGYFDNPVGYGISIYMNQFLTEVFSTVMLETTANSFYIDIINNILYINIPRLPWQYADEFSAAYASSGTAFTTAPKDERNLSDVYYESVKTYPRMKVPTLNNKLNDVISGIIVYNDFSIVIDNSDGLFDDINIIDFFNTPIQIGKTDIEATSVTDFNRIRLGLVDDIAVAFDTLQIKGVDQFYRMNKDFCRKFTLAEYPNLDDGDVNTDIPVAWGPVLGVGLVEIDKDAGTPPEWIEYIAIDPDYITSVEEVYDSDGNTLTHSFDAGTGVITITELDIGGEVIEAECANVTGKLDSRIGVIIIEALESNENISYVPGLWDVAETDLYLDFCASVGFLFTGGTTRDLIEQVLKNDTAFLIQKNNGLLSLRQWGQEYDTWEISSWLATAKPKKNFKDASKYFCSTVHILSHKNHNNDNYTQTYIDNTRESEIFENYRRSYSAIFQTDLLDDLDISDLAWRLLQRFGTVRETVTVGFGVDTFQINLLDTIVYDCIINDRQFSTYEAWTVKECDPGQDTMVMEGASWDYEVRTVSTGEFRSISTSPMGEFRTIRNTVTI
jgi:hypothetical protein